MNTDETRTEETEEPCDCDECPCEERSDCPCC
jgi:hypothetical protein